MSEAPTSADRVERDLWLASVVLASIILGWKLARGVTS